MGALGVVELERPSQCLQHALGGAAHVAAFQARVVRDAHAGQDGDLFAAQAGNATGAVGRQPGLLGRDPGAAGGEELADLRLRLHESQRRPGDARLGDPASTSLDRGSHLLRIRALLDVMTTEKKTWLITGAGRGMGVDIAKAALAAGHNVVATGRNPDAVAEAARRRGRPARRQARRHQHAGRRGGGQGGRRSLRRHRRARQQRRQLLRRLLRGAHARADGPADHHEPDRPDERHPRRPAGHAQAALRARRDDLLVRGLRRLRVRHRLRRVEVRRRRLDGVARPRDRAVRHPHDGRQPGVLPHRAAHEGVDELRPGVDRGLRRAQRRPARVLGGHERQAGRRPGQARPGAADHHRPGAAAVPVHRRRRRARAGRGEARRTPAADRRLPRPVVLARARRCGAPRERLPDNRRASRSSSAPGEAHADRRRLPADRASEEIRPRFGGSGERSRTWASTTCSPTTTCSVPCTPIERLR